MKLQFKIDPDYIFLHAINQSQPNVPFKEWIDFTNDIWEKSKEIFYFLGGYAEYRLYSIKIKNIEKIAKKAEETFDQIRKTKEFQRLIAETVKYRQFIEKQWRQNEKKSLKTIKELSGLILPRETIKVYITHPELKNGMTIDNQTIVWGHSEDWKNYSTVYLCHELMHILTNHDGSNEVHAVIELMTDNELRIRLNGRGEYFECPGHPNLKKLEKLILPSWKNYLKKKDKNIFRFIESVRKKRLLHYK
jgi:hypothetical protein